MKYLRVCIPVFFVALLTIISCQKEKSYELSKTPAHGTLQSDINQECLPKTVYGAYIGAKALTDSNYIDIEIDVVSPGVYNITTDTLNGYSFSAKGNFTTSGSNTIKLAGSGTPIGAGVNNFLVAFDSSFCYVPVTVLPVGTGAASFTLQGSGSDCLNSVVSGSYVSGTALTLTNKVAIQVNVTKIGTYSISTTTVNGMTFAASGVLIATGSQTITLSGTGTPSNEGSTVVSVAAGASSCTFTVNVTSVATFDYFPRVAGDNWSYEFDGNASDTLYVTAIAQTVNLIGNTYNVFFETADLSAGYDSSGYYRKSGNDYYKYFDLGSFVGFASPMWVEQNFLKDNSSAGTTWTTAAYSGTVGSTAITVRVRFTVSQKDVSFSVQGTTYPNTIIMEERAEQLINGSWVDITAAAGIIKSYYSRDVGLIKQQQSDLTSGNSLYNMELTRHQVF